MSAVDQSTVREDILSYLQSWFEKVHAKKAKKGITLNLSFQEWLELWGKRRISSLTKWKDGKRAFRGTLVPEAVRPS